MKAITQLDVFYQNIPALKEQTCYFFFDEIQLVLGWEQFVRRVLDNENAQVYVTGSSAKLLSCEIATSIKRLPHSGRPQEPPLKGAKQHVTPLAMFHYTPQPSNRQTGVTFCDSLWSWGFSPGQKR